MQLSALTLTERRHVWRIHPNGWSIESNLDADSVAFMAEKWRKSTAAHTQRSLVNFLNLYSHLGISADVPKRELPLTDIRHLEGISNSKLTRLKNELQGKPTTYPERCLVFGQAFHAVALEAARTEDPEWNLRPSEWRAIGQMRDAYICEFGEYVRSEKLYGSRVETPVTWTDEVTGLPCKALLDLQFPGLVFDLKTTSAFSREQFAEQLAAFDYDRQAAFYLDGSGADAFGFVAVQKRHPFDVFIVTHERESEFIEEGRRKYQFLLRKFGELGERV